MNKIRFKVIYCLKNLVRFFFQFLHSGSNCAICGCRTFVFPVCNNCQKKYMQFSHSKKRCSVCGKELLSSESVCCSCKESPVISHIDQMIPLFSYRLWNKELLFDWKINGERSLSFFFARLIKSVLDKLDFDAVIPVPPRPSKIKENGWDQIDELTNLLEFVFGFKVFRFLVRKSTLQQKKLHREDRFTNIKEAYSILSDNEIKEIISKEKFPETVCLIDDVTTTGATLECCAKLLKEAGVKKVIGITLFIVD